MNFKLPITKLDKVGAAVAKRLDKIGIHTIEDLLYYFPFRYENYEGLVVIKNLKEGQYISVKAKVELIANRRSFRSRKTMTEALISDDSGSLRLVWFNQPYVQKNIKVGEEIIFSGTVKNDMLGAQLINPTYQKNLNSQAPESGLIPIYYLTAGISQKYLRFLVKQALISLDEKIEFLPKHIHEVHDLLPLNLALHGIHFPADQTDLNNSNRRLKFDELFLLQLKGEIARKLRYKEKSQAIKFNEMEIKKLVGELPFVLTKAQKIATWEVLKDLEKAIPMNRLLSGDVGSGKTVVAAMSMYNVCLNGFQSVMMAPTEILAKQHFVGVAKLLGKKLNIALLTRSNCLGVQNGIEQEYKKNNLIKLISDGAFDIILGTHALISEKVNFQKLALVVVDEQHRFGVEQRKIIKEKSKNNENAVAHFLSMTATPIPRSLALAMYGDLDLSTIDEMPEGRKIIKTRLVEDINRQKAYDFIREQIKKGRQAFVVCPLITKDENAEKKITFDWSDDKKTVMSEHEHLSKEIFPEFKIDFLHGKMPAKEKDLAMKKFKDGETKILVSTAVVEVGVDIPNASVMMIEGAERFGLAQLHQFRGRVGRAEHQSFCLLFVTGNASPNTMDRLSFFEKNNIGFKLAEKDLETRGPGEVFGAQQSGEGRLQLANLTDVEIIKMARNSAKEVIENLDKFPFLSQKMKDFEEKVHLE